LIRRKVTLLRAGGDVTDEQGDVAFASEPCWINGFDWIEAKKGTFRLTWYRRMYPSLKGLSGGSETGHVKERSLERR
jgi:hypothetical protein